MILESILLNMYSPERPNARSLSFVRSAHERLDEFWAQLPRDLRMEKGNMPDVCPPSNGILLKWVSSSRLAGDGSIMPHFHDVLLHASMACMTCNPANM